jgi:isopenicillin-N N-acyltransferase-like protein
MAGVNDRGVGIAINNLHSTDARVGVVWPALVRRALRESGAHAARDVILAAPVGSGHHYLVADQQRAIGIETSGQVRKVIYEGEPDHYVHANHCLDPGVAARSRIPPGSTTGDRFDAMTRSVAAAPIADVRDAWRRLGSTEGYPRSVCTNMATPQTPHAAATCGAIAIDLAGRFALAEAGFPNNVEPHRFDFESPA